MFIVEGFRKLGRDNFSHPASQVIVKTSDGKIVFVAMDIEGTLVLGHAQEPGFEQLVTSLGLTATQVKSFDFK